MGMRVSILILVSTLFDQSVAYDFQNHAGSADKLTVSSALGLDPTALPPWPSYAPASAPSSALQQQDFWAGGCVGTMLRLEAIPNRTFYAEDAQTPLDSIDALQEAGFNAIRIETNRNMSSSPTTSFNNSGNVLYRELNSLLDIGNIDIAVLTAGLAKERNMNVVLTLNMGADIPPAWQQYNYSQMLGAIDGEVRRQLVPFLQAGVQPDIILFENENSVGFLYTVTLPNGEEYDRGTGTNAQVSADQLRQELCGILPTGHTNSYPQIAGYYKQEILSCQDAILKAGFDSALTRYGLHSQQKYVDWKQSLVYNTTNPDLELAVSVNGTNCSFEGVIPQNILTVRAADRLDIMGFSSYPSPTRPNNVSSTRALNETFHAVRQTLSLMDEVVSRYGRYTEGPFLGQYRKQGLAVEYASEFSYPDELQYQQQHTKMYFDVLQSRPYFLGALWWEPTYAFNNWNGGSASLYHKWTSGAFNNDTNEAPTSTLAYWGSFARSP